MKTALVLGAGGFIGSHLVNRLKSENYWVRGVDLKKPDFEKSTADEFILGDLRDPHLVSNILDKDFDEVYQLAADMGGAGYIFTGDNDANVMHNSALINLNILYQLTKVEVKKIFYSSSACIYPEHNQLDPNNPNCEESSAYPANPDSEYGWEKLFSERMYKAFSRNYKLEVRIARFHNIFGPQGTYDGGKEKAPAALCRKVALAKDNDTIEIWGDGEQTRSFLYIDECIEAVRRLMESNFSEPVNIGSEEMVTINSLAQLIIKHSGKDIKLKHIEGPLGVRGRNSDNTLLRRTLNWEPTFSLNTGIKLTYNWINSQLS